jgi:signal transduction histidine kinase
LPRSDAHVSHPIDARFGGRFFRLRGSAITGGRIVVATSTQDVGSVRATLLLIEGILAPIVLLSLFIAATIIGRRAAAPIERARRRQLEFTADASHELRTPLSVIEAEVGLALNANRPASAYRSALERVSGESKRLRSIVDDLLWLARLDSLPATPPHEAVDMASLARSCAERFEAIAMEKRLSISVLDGVGPPPLVLAPAEWLDRLVSVLVDNACRYSNESGRVEVSVSSSDGRVTLIVDDDGPGIPEEEREHIAQRFHRASSAPGGAGLGLSIADAVVRATSGDWKVATAPLGGARIEACWQRFQADDGYDETADDQRFRAPARQ